MTDITIPPEAVEAGASACYEYWRDKDTTGALPPWETERFMPFRDGWREQATAAITAALKAWPGMRFMVDIDTGDDAAIKLPLSEKQDD